MTINKFLTFTGGVALVAYDIVSIFKGQIYGVAASGYSRLITSEENPVYFWFSVIIGLVIGGMLIYAAFERD